MGGRGASALSGNKIVGIDVTYRDGTVSSFRQHKGITINIATNEEIPMS